jgi:iron complex outermembrane recepter protein
VNVADIINEFPCFWRTQSPKSGGIANAGANNIDLRGLAPIRTLVLLDRLRLPAVNQPGATIAGATDLNVIPAALIRQVNIISGSASAAYGSDAIASVGNLQINTRLDGFKFNVQGGQTRYGDVEDSSF